MWRFTSANRLLAVAAWLAFLAAVIATVEATYANSGSLAALQHADFLYLPMLYRDLVVLGGRLTDWALPPTPYFFPDFIGYAFLRIFSSNQDWTAIGAQILMPTSVALIATYVARQVGSLQMSLQTLTLLSLLLLAYARGWSRLAGDILMFSCHGGQVTVALIGFALLLRPTAPRIMAASALAFCAALSDPLFVMAALVPTVFLVWSFAPAGRARCLKIVALVAANVSGLAVRPRLPVPPPLGSTIDIERSAKVLRAFAAHLGDADAYSVYFGLALAVSAIVLSWRNAKRRAIVLALVLSILATFLGLCLIGADIVVGESRYLIMIPVALAILVPVGVQVIVKESLLSWTLILGTLAICAATVVQLRDNIGNIGRIRLSPMACFDAFASTHDMHRCVASYWLAKPITLLANKPVTVIQTRADGKPDWWINTRRYNSEGIEVDCAVFPDQEARYFVRRFGEPESSEECDGNRIMIFGGISRHRLNERLQPLLHLDLPRRM